MRRSVGLVAVVLAASLAGCSSGDAVTIEVRDGELASERGMQEPAVIVFQASGAAVDDATLCESGTLEPGRLESPEGVVITPAEGSELHVNAQANRRTLDLYAWHEFVCDDGSGTFKMKVHSFDDFAKDASEQEPPTWRIEYGTGDHGGLSGSGEVVVDLSASPEEAVAVYVGEVDHG